MTAKIFQGMRVGRGTTLYVASSTANTLSKLFADYVCDGIADDVEINAALASLPAVGGTVILSEGLFTYAAGIAPTKANCTLRGSGVGATTLQAVSGSTVNVTAFALSQTRTVLADLTIDCNKAGTTGTKTGQRNFSVSSPNCVVENVRGLNSGGNGIDVSGVGARLFNVFITSSDFVGFNITGPTLITSQPSVFIACHAEVAGATGIQGWDISASYCHFIGCTSRGCGNNGVSMPGSFNKISGGSYNGNGATGINVSGSFNQITDVGAHGNGGNGITVTGSGNLVDGCLVSGNAIGIQLGGGSKNTVKSCSINACTSSGILNDASADSLILGNDVQGSASQGIYIVNSGANGTAVIGNMVRENGTATNNSYSNIQISADNCHVSGNTCRAGASGNRANYGVQIGGTNTYVGLNDLYTGGVSGEILEGGTNTRRPVRALVTGVGGDTINTTAAETNFATNFVLPANTLFSVGKVIRVRAWGEYSTLGSGTVTLQLKLKMGATTLLDFATVTTAISIANRRWSIEADIVVRATGASGTFMCFGEARIPTANDNTTNLRPMIGATVTIDTTAAQTLQISAQHGASSASNSIIMYEFNVEVLN